MVTPEEQSTIGVILIGLYIPTVFLLSDCY